MERCKENLVISFDIKSDGNNPLVNNMLSVGACAITHDENIISTFYVNIKELDDHISDRKCMEEFWAHEQLAWLQLQENKLEFYDACYLLSEWLIELSKEYRLEFVSGPACFNWMFLKSYYEMAKMINKKIKYDIGYNCTCLTTILSIHKKQSKMDTKQWSTFETGLVNVNIVKLHNSLYDSQVKGLKFIRLLKIMA